ncbi:hypothetical protein [Allokutzneria oryzae]|uniref:Uncharacterized protein n=1 Tax=Allokutzneria oryzae TaxID=1378989 RepID=A0ABV5ZW75_9PSEU
MVTMIVTWVGIAAAMAVLVLMALSDHMNDNAQPAGRIAPKQARKTLHRPAAAPVARRTVAAPRSAHLPTAA